jgi:uncharacterized protein (TIGR03435 family)
MKGKLLPILVLAAGLAGGLDLYDITATMPRASQKQVGLKLVKSKGFPLDIVIDHIEKVPAANQAQS